MTSDEIRELKTFLGERFEKVDERFDAMDQRFDAMDQRFEEIDQRFENVDRRFDGMDEEHRDLVHLLGRRFTSIDERLESLDERVESLDKAVRKNGVTLEEVRGELKLTTELVLANAEKIEVTKGVLVEEIEAVDEKIHFLGEEIVPRIEALEP